MLVHTRLLHHTHTHTHIYMWRPFPDSRIALLQRIKERSSNSIILSTAMILIWSLQNESGPAIHAPLIMVSHPQPSSMPVGNAVSSLRDEGKRLLYVMQQVSDGIIVLKKIRKQLQSDAVVHVSYSPCRTFLTPKSSHPSHQNTLQHAKSVDKSMTLTTTSWRLPTYVGRSTVLKEPRKMFVVLGGSAVRCGSMTVITALMPMTWVSATKKPMTKGLTVKTAILMQRISCT